MPAPSETPGPDDPSRRLFDLLIRSLGYLEGNLVHAYTPAFHRLPRLFAAHGPRFIDCPEVRDVCAAVVGLLEARQGPGGAERALRLQILELLASADGGAADRAGSDQAPGCRA